ncbi:MAG: hypothetical protein K6D37_12550 [Prevotella sp.]|nr:hypothetical protein [Prevotella sp.]
MKKTYIEPAMTIVNVQMESLMETISYAGTANSVEGDARGGSSWDDED